MEDFPFPDGYEIFVLGSGDRIHNRPEGIWIGVSRGACLCGLRFPLHSFYFEILGVLGISLGQLCPNAFTQMCGFIAICKRRSIEPRNMMPDSQCELLTSREEVPVLLGR